MKTVGERIRQAREHRGLSGEQLAHQVGYKTQSGISNLENRATGRGGYMLSKIAEELNFALEWFLDGPDTEDMNTVPAYRNTTSLHLVANGDAPLFSRAPPAVQAPAGALSTHSQRLRHIYVVGKGQGGMPERIWSDGDHPVGMTDEYSDIHTADPHAFLVRIEGSSMYPKFETGNYVLVEPGTEPELEECVLVRLQSGETLIKRLLSRRHTIRLGSFSSPEILEYQPDDVTWMYYIAHEVPRRKIKTRH